MSRYSPVVMSTNSLVAKGRKLPEFLSKEEVYIMANSDCGRYTERNKLFILLLFQTGLRISEAINIRTKDISKYENGYAVYVVGKGKKHRHVAIPENLVSLIESYCYRKKIDKNNRIWKFTRFMGFRIVKRMAKNAGIEKRIYPHILRHSNAIYSLSETRVPVACQKNLGHSSMKSTMIYWGLLQNLEAVKIHQQIDFE